MIVVQKLKTPIAAAFQAWLFLIFFGNAALLAPALAQASPADSVSVEKEPIHVETKTFDHAAPGPEVPLKGREAATTHANFGYDIEDITCTAESSKRNGEMYVGTFKVMRIAVKLTLPVTLWLPDTVNKRLREHEDGHRQIYEEIYGGVEKTAKRQAEAMIGQTFVGEGKTLELAQRDAQRKTAIELNRRYCDEVLVYAKLVSQLYDNATHSGTNRAPVFLAIREAFFQAWFINLTHQRR